MGSIPFERGKNGEHDGVGLVEISNIFIYSFKDHVEYTLKKVRQRNRILWKLRSFIEAELARTLYLSLIAPLFNYCSEIYDGCFLNQSRKLQVAQNQSLRAFGTIPHDKLLFKLDHYSIKGLIHSWISTFLKQHDQYVVVDGLHSHWVHVDSGVLQGRVLGPLLFLVNINNLSSKVTSRV